MNRISIGQKIRHFEIVDVIGGGAMGEVFKARDLHLQRFIALKVMIRQKKSWVDSGSGNLPSE